MALNVYITPQKKFTLEFVILTNKEGRHSSHALVDTNKPNKKILY